MNLGSQYGNNWSPFLERVLLSSGETYCPQKLLVLSDHLLTNFLTRFMLYIKI